MIEFEWKYTNTHIRHPFASVSWLHIYIIIILLIYHCFRVLFSDCLRILSSTALTCLFVHMTYPSIIKREVMV